MEHDFTILLFLLDSYIIRKSSRAKLDLNNQGDLSRWENLIQAAALDVSVFFV